MRGGLFLLTIGLILSCRELAAMELARNWGGHVKVLGKALCYDDDSYWGLWDDDFGEDSNLDFRLKNTLGLGSSLDLETHLVVDAWYGDTYEKTRDIRMRFPFLSQWLFSFESAREKRRLFDLSHTLSENSQGMVSYRLDRLALTVRQPWGLCRIGRQVVTWGNGLIFNPMDVFNPFAPTDTDRDYKSGDDMVYFNAVTERFGDIQFLYVPRRDMTDGRIESDQSSWAAKTHIFKGNLEMDLMGACHYDEGMAGMGLAGNAGGATLRSDLVWSGLQNSDRDESGYLSFVANADYSWILWDKNVYGLIEYYHNGLGHHRPEDSLYDSDLIDRIGRGECYVTGKDYLAGQIQVEIHALLNVLLSLIVNLDDTSLIIQPRMVWDMTQNTRLQWGLTLYQGGRGSEFGGFTVPGTDVTTENPDSMDLTLSWYF